MVGTSYVNVRQFSGGSPTSSSTTPGEMNFAAYNAAREFVLQKNPAVKTFSDFSRSPVERNGTRYFVMLQVDELAANKEPVRSFYRVEVEYTDRNWQLKGMTQ